MLLPPTILIAATTWSPASARLAHAFALAGCRVSVISPPGHPARSLRLVRRHLSYRARRPLADLRAAITSTSPDLVLACDARALTHLHLLHKQETSAGDPSRIAAQIERSLGDPASYPTVQSQASLLQIARSLAICTPETRTLHSPADLAAWRDLHPLPWVLKVNGGSSSARTHIVHSWEQAVHTLSLLEQPLSTSAALRHLCEHDLFPLTGLDREQPEITIQTHVPGSLATAMYACRDGEIVAGLAVTVLSTHPGTGTPTIVRTLHSPAIAHAARVMGKQLGLSGFFALDFLLGQDTEEAYLVAVHPYATQLGHLRPGGQSNLVTALLSPPETASAPGADAPLPSPEKTIAFFPQAWLSNPDDPVLASPATQHDIPWGEPKLLRDLYKVHWTQRHRSARLFDLASRLQSRKTRPPHLKGSVAHGK